MVHTLPKVAIDNICMINTGKVLITDEFIKYNNENY